MRRSPAYIETPQIRLPPAVNISCQNIRGVHSEHTQNFIYPSLKCKWPIHTKLLAPNDLISLSYRTQYCVWNDNVYYELKKKIDLNILVLPDQCSRTFWAFSRYRYRDTIRAGNLVPIGLTHWGQVTHICVSKLAIIGSDNGLSPERRQANIWTNAVILLIGNLGTNFSEILSESHIFSFKKMLLKTSSAKRRPFCLGLNVLRYWWTHITVSIPVWPHALCHCPGVTDPPLLSPSYLNFQG